MFSSLVGETERNNRETLAVVDKLEPSIVFMDEIEKALAGVQSSGKTDGGTGSRVFATFLQWLNHHESDSYVVATCNSIEDLPPEFLRQERWDGISLWINWAMKNRSESGSSTRPSMSLKISIPKTSRAGRGLRSNQPVVWHSCKGYPWRIR